MTVPQLESALQLSAQLLTATEKDRDEWKAAAIKLEKELRQRTEALRCSNERVAQLETRMLSFRERMREFAESEV